MRRVSLLASGLLGGALAFAAAPRAAEAQIGVRVGGDGAARVRTGRGAIPARDTTSPPTPPTVPPSPANRAPAGYAPVNRAPGVPGSALQPQPPPPSDPGGPIPVPPRGRPIIIRGGVIYGDVPPCEPPPPPCDGAHPAATAPAASAGAGSGQGHVRVYRPRYPQEPRVPDLDSARTATPLVRQPFEQAAAALREARYEDALDAFRQAIYAGADGEGRGGGASARRTVRLGLALAYLGLGRHGAAEVAFRAALPADAAEPLDLEACLRAIYELAPAPELLASPDGDHPIAQTPFLRGVLALVGGDPVLAAWRLDEQVRRDPLDRVAARLLDAVLARTGMAPPSGGRALPAPSAAIGR